MKLTALKCPNCNGEIDNHDELNTFYCKYCGYQIVMDELTNAEINAKVEIAGMHHAERMQDKTHTENHAKWERNEKAKKRNFKRSVILGACIAIACIIFFTSIFAIAKSNSDRQEQKLQVIVEEVLAEIENGNYTAARIKAEAIHYTADWSDDIEKKWDNIRKELLKEINKAEKGNGERSGIFDWFD